MRASQPQQLPDMFVEALNAGDVDAVVSLYEPDGVVAPYPNQLVAGHAAIRSMVSGFLALKPRFSLQDSEVVQTGDLALVRSRMTVKTSDLTGQTIEIAIRPTLIVRWHPDGGWLVAIDRPLTAA